MGVKMGWIYIQIKMVHPLAQNGAALAPVLAEHTPSFLSISVVDIKKQNSDKEKNQFICS